MILSPARPASHPDTDTDCQQAAEAEFQDLAHRMEAAGWDGETAARALLGLAVAHIRARIGKAAVERAIGLAREGMEEQ